LSLEEQRSRKEAGVTENTGRYKTPGELVQTAREERSLSLDDLSTQTKIPLYIRSFLKSLAQELDLDAELLLERYEHLAGPDEDEDTPAEDDPTWETETRILPVAGFPWRPVIISFSAVAVIVLAIMMIRSFTGGSDEPVLVENTDNIATVQTDDATEEPTDDRQEATPTESEPAVEQDPTPAPVPAPASLTPGSTELVFDDGKQWPWVFRLVMDRPIELSVSADGKPVAIDWDHPGAGVPSEDVTAGRVYRAGSRSVLYFCAEGYFVVTLGTVEGVVATLNGVDLPIPVAAVGHEWLVDETRLPRD